MYIFKEKTHLYCLNSAHIGAIFVNKGKTGWYKIALLFVAIMDLHDSGSQLGDGRCMTRENTHQTARRWDNDHVLNKAVRNEWECACKVCGKIGAGMVNKRTTCALFLMVVCGRKKFNLSLSPSNATAWSAKWRRIGRDRSTGEVTARRSNVARASIRIGCYFPMWQRSLAHKGTRWCVWRKGRMNEDGDNALCLSQSANGKSGWWRWTNGVGSLRRVHFLNFFRLIDARIWNSYSSEIAWKSEETWTDSGFFLK